MLNFQPTELKCADLHLLSESILDTLWSLSIAMGNIYIMSDGFNLLTKTSRITSLRYWLLLNHSLITLTYDLLNYFHHYLYHYSEYCYLQWPILFVRFFLPPPQIYITSYKILLIDRVKIINYTRLGLHQPVF